MRLPGVSLGCAAALYAAGDFGGIMATTDAASLNPASLQVPGTLEQYINALEDAGVLAGVAGSTSIEDVAEIPISLVSYDSRSVGPDTLFICKGAAFKEDYLVQAQSAGAVAYVSETNYTDVDLPCLLVDDIRAALGPLAALAYGDPASHLRISTFTGTKGKTTSAFYLKGILDQQARIDECEPCALISTILIDNGRHRILSKLTSPEPLELNLYLASAWKLGSRDVVMESSSQALKYGRVAGVEFEVGAFTNISEDHISPIEHPTFEDYFASKLTLFRQCRHAVVNLDMDMVDRVLDAASVCESVLTYSMSDPAADVYAEAWEQRGHKTVLTVKTPRFTVDVTVPTIADFNLSNALGAIACAEALGCCRAAIEHGLAEVRVPGRMERIESRDPNIVGLVDYAHNEVSMRALLENVRRSYPDRELCCVFGSTGDKGVERREGMGRVAGELADRIIITEDDAGTQSVMDICKTIESYARAAGATDIQIEPDRERAARLAVRGCDGPAIIVMAGKGHERHMIRAHGRDPYEGDSSMLARVFDQEVKPVE